MKKILGISLVALFAAMPMMAKAADVNTVDATGNALTTQSYVKGAFNVLAEGINTKQDQIKAGEADVATSIVQAAGVHEATAEGINSAADDAMISEKAVLTAINASVGTANSAWQSAINGLDTSVSTAQDAALSVTVVQSNGLLSSVTASINQSAVTSDKIADGTITNADINDNAAIAGTKLAADVQTALSHAESAYGAIYDNGGLNSRVTAAESAISDEETARKATDSSLQDQIDALSGAASPTANGHYIHSDYTVASNLEALDSAVYANQSAISANASAISAINDINVSVATTWGTDSTESRSITALDAAVTAGE